MLTLFHSFTDDASAKEVSRVRYCLIFFFFIIYLLKKTYYCIRIIYWFFFLLISAEQWCLMKNINMFIHSLCLWCCLVAVTKAGFSLFSKTNEEKGCHMRQKIGCKFDFRARRISAWHSYFCHLPTGGPEGAQVSVHDTQVNPRAVKLSFTNTWRKKKTTPKVSWPLSASSICLQRGCGRIEVIPQGKDFKCATVSVVRSSLSLQAQN